jgi:hypothetical protein
VNWLLYYDSSLPYADRLTTDFQNRFLAGEWNSPQWAGTYVVIHANSPSGVINPQTRLVDTPESWASILGIFDLFSAAAEQNVTSLLTGFDGYAPAWQLLMNSSSQLFDPTTMMFKGASNGVEANVYNAWAVGLMLVMGIVPINATLAVPVEEMHEEYVYSMFDQGLVGLNGHTITMGLSRGGTMEFIYNATVSYTFPDAGVYNVTFNSDWSQVVSVKYAGQLPTNRKYLLSPQYK